MPDASLAQPVTWVHRVLFFTGIISVALAYVTCFIIMKVQGFYDRDINVPFFSDLGRDSPNVYIFVLGLSVASIFQAILPWIVFSEVIRPKLREVGKWYLNVIAYITLVSSILSAPILPAIGLWPVNTHLDTHCEIAKGYFVTTLLTHLLQLALYYGLYRSVTKECPWRDSVKTWGLRRACLVLIAFPYFAQTIAGLNTRYITYEEAMTRIEHMSPGISEASCFEGVQKYPWRRKNGKSLCDPYRCPIPADEFERIPEGEPMPELRVTSLQSYRQCRAAGYLLTMSQATCIFAMTFAYVTFYFDFVFARQLQRAKEE